MRSLIFLPALVLAGCGGSSTGNEGLFFGGTTSTESASNGQSFANSALAGTIRGQTYEARVARHIRESDGTTRTVVTTETVTLASNSVTEEPYIASITIDGQTLNINPSTTTGVLNGQEYSTYTLTTGAYSTEVNTYSYEYDDGNRNDELFASVGFETNPANMPTSGGATYQGGLEAFGTLTIDNVPDYDFVLAGDLLIVANFDASTVSGSMQDATLITQSPSGVETNQVNAIMAQTEITGNGFETDFSVGCLSGYTCTSNSQAGGAFYGPSADEVSGLVLINEAATDTVTGQVFQFEGVGAFGAD